MRTGEVVEMPSGYDEFSERASPDYMGGTTRQRWHRDLLRRVMEAQGFTVYQNEWWHFDYNGWRNYPIGNATFEEILARR
jgi:D-alanyl-D-alanine dipeptidase